MLEFLFRLPHAEKRPPQKAIQDRKAQLDLRVHRAFKEWLVHRVNREHRVRKGRRALLEKREIRAKKEKRATKEIPVKATRAIEEKRATRATLATQCAPSKLMVK